VPAPLLQVGAEGDGAAAHVELAALVEDLMSAGAIGLAREAQVDAGIADAQVAQGDFRQPLGR